MQIQLQRTSQQLWRAAAGLDGLAELPAAILLRATVESAADACSEASDVWTRDPVAAVRHVYAAQLLLRTNERAFHDIAAAARHSAPPEIEHTYLASREIVEELFLAIW